MKSEFFTRTSLTPYPFAQLLQFLAAIAAWARTDGIAGGAIRLAGRREDAIISKSSIFTEAKQACGRETRRREDRRQYDEDVAGHRKEANREKKKPGC